jgi:hypothetical protein
LLHLCKYHHPETWPHFIHAYSCRNQVWQRTSISKSLFRPVCAVHGFPPPNDHSRVANSESERFLGRIDNLHVRLIFNLGKKVNSRKEILVTKCCNIRKI